ncbi:MAG: phosphatase PAP2 family protein [Solirubrobacteraceae bacterium]
MRPFPRPPAAIRRGLGPPAPPGASAAGAPRALRAPRTLHARRPNLVFEALIVAWLGWLYDILTNVTPLRAHAAIANAWGVWHAERLLHIDPELALNHWLAAHHTLGQIASYYYDNAHFIVTFGLLALLWWRLPASYRPLRSALALVNLIAFAVFWLYPLAPPRMLPSVGFHDIVAHSGTFGQWHTGSLASSADQFAAMPSLHLSWAVWSAVAVWRITSRRSLRALAIAYPFLTSAVVFATGNHYLLDVLGGIAAMALSFALVGVAGTVRAGLPRGALRRRAGGTARVPAPASSAPAPVALGAGAGGEASSAATGRSGTI